MSKINLDSQIPCIIDQGIIFNKQDMLRVLQALDHVVYKEIVDNTETIKREGFVVEIFEDAAQASIVFNRRLHLNVNSFEFFKIIYHNLEQTVYSIELHMYGGRIIVLSPKTDPLDNPQNLLTEIEERRRNNNWMQLAEEDEY